MHVRHCGLRVTHILGMCRCYAAKIKVVITDVVNVEVRTSFKVRVAVWVIVKVRLITT